MNKFLLFLTALLIHADIWAMKTTVVNEKKDLDQQRMNIAQHFANSGYWPLAFNVIYPMALEGHPMAQANLGVMFNTGRGVRPSVEQAYWWFSSSAESGNIKALNNLALMYYKGSYIERNESHAIKLFELTANAKDQASMLMLSEIYFLKNDYVKSLKWLKTCAELGNDEAKLRLGEFYENGFGVPKDKQKAIKLYEEIINAKDAAPNIKEFALKNLNRLVKPAIKN